MCATFSEDDVGKTVENEEGRAVGTVAAVEGGAAEVDTDPSLGDSIRAALGWESDPDETARIDADAVAEITDEAVRLESSPTGQRDLGPTSGELGGPSEGSPGESDSGADRSDDTEDAPPEGDRTVTRERGEEDDG